MNTAPIDGYLRELAERKGTDLLISAGTPPWVRVDGQIRRLDGRSLTPDDAETLARTVLEGPLSPSRIRSNTCTTANSR